MPKEDFKREAEKAKRGETKPHEIIYFKIYKSQIPVFEQAPQACGIDVGNGQLPRPHCLKMSCADFLAGASLKGRDPRHPAASHHDVLQVPAGRRQAAFLEHASERAS